MPTRAIKNTAMHFKTTIQTEVPQGRNGRHKLIVTTILMDLARLDRGAAVKVPLADLVGSKEQVLSALNRATRKAGLEVATASEATFVYTWNVKESGRNAMLRGTRSTSLLGFLRLKLGQLR